MPTFPKRCLLAAPAVAFLALFPGTHIMASEIDMLAERFADPPREFTNGPLWVWNDRMTEPQVRAQLRDLASKNLRQAFVHPRPGLMTPYLSEEWFALWKAVLDEAERLDMNIWIYDENSYPSGFAGGFVPEAMPESRGQGLHLRERPAPPSWTQDTVAVFRLTDDGYEDVSAAFRPADRPEADPTETHRRDAGGTPSTDRQDADPTGEGAALEGPYLVASRVWSPPGPWYGGWWYVDLIRPGVTEAFLELTLEPYRREIGDAFGERIPGVFTDEPNLVSAGSLPWTEDLPERFEDRWGYRLTDHLPELVRQVGDFRRVRHNYFQLLNDLFVDRWARPYYDYCEEHGLEFTGHYWEHEWPRALRVPDNMAMYAWQQRPGIDILMNRYDDVEYHAQFGNARAVRELASVANQLGRPRTLCEAYGAGGWDLRLEDIKRIGDWLLVLGVNTINEHLSFATIRGARKRDHPQSFSYHAPWWESYDQVALYLARLSAALSHGEQVNTILLLQPTTTAWMYNSQEASDPQLRQLGLTFQRMVFNLEQNQVGYDIGSEDLIRRFGSVRKADEAKGRPAAFVIGERAYDTVVVPPMTENLNGRTYELLGAFLEAGGTVLSCGEPPGRRDGAVSYDGLTLSRSPGWKEVAPAELPMMLVNRDQNGFAIRRAPQDQGILFHQRRRLDDGELLFLVNTSLESPSSGTIEHLASAVETWNPHDGRRRPVAFEPMDEGIRVAFDLPPGGSRLFVFSERMASDGADAMPDRLPAGRPDRGSIIQPTGGMAVRRVDPNVLTLDYVDLHVGGDTYENLDAMRAGHRVFREHGFDRNPWDRGVQFRDELIRQTFPEDSGFEATYRFVIEDEVPAPLFIVIERADIYAITCNDEPVKPVPDVWWLDRAFIAVDIAPTARVGENRVTIRAAPFNVYHELEAAYVTGDFALKPAEAGFVIVPAQPIEAGPWHAQGLPLYGHRVAYRQTFDVAEPDGRYVVVLPRWQGSVARVSVNGTDAGDLWHQPWEVDVTGAVASGANTIEVVVTGTLKNTLGPHHGNPPLGMAWPAMWEQAPEHGPPPGGAYHTVEYGLFEPFILEHREH